jgi:hypothetical protein
MMSMTPRLQTALRRSVPRLAGALLAVLGALASPGCGAAQRDVEPLDASLRVYNDGLRWQRFDDSASRLPAAQRDDFLDERDQLHEDLRISDYEVIRVRYDGKQRRAKVQIKYTWYLESRGVVHETHAVQTWQRGDTIWILRNERFLRGEPMPGLDGDASKSETPAATPEPPAEPSTDAPEQDPATPAEPAEDAPLGS